MNPPAAIGPATSLLSSALPSPPPGFAPLWFRNELIGAVSPTWLPHLDNRLFKLGEINEDGQSVVRIRGGDRRGESGLVPAPTLNRWFAEWAESLRSRELLPGWRGEIVHLYGVKESESLLQVERSLVRPLGLLLRTVQVNVFSLQDKRLKIWVARRADAKPVDPGKLDCLVAGGIAGDETPLEALVRECQEEAGIPRALARRAVPVGVIDSIAPAMDGATPILHRERATLYDLKVSLEFSPAPTDAEFAQVQCLPAVKVLDSLARDAWTREGAWATRDLIARRGPA